MAEQTSGTNENQNNPIEINDWASAFAALEPKSEETDSSDSNVESTDDSGTTTNTDGASEQQKVSDTDETIDGSGSSDDTGGLDTDAGISDGEDQSAFAEFVGSTEEDVKKLEEQINEEIRNQAINEVAQEFIKRGVRNRNGALGATLDDSDICKRDSDGVPHFYNPETGQEFHGDNPRRQAQEWVDDYNKELARVFNNTCQEYEQHLAKDSAPRIKLMKFAPRYKKLDAIRKGMFNNVVEDYEIKNNEGKVIGYSCDLDKALALVERQVAMIQNYAKQHKPNDNQPTGPAIDMKTSSGAVQTNDEVTAPKSLAEAMERLQDAQIDKLKRS